MGGAARRREKRAAAAPATGGSCAFCGSDAQDETTVGRLYLLESTTVHYYCALLSCGLVQRGADEEGLFGFLLHDIHAELYRGKKLKCSYCGSGGATVACCVSQCRKMFHLPCGRRRGTVSIFYGSYSSFCIAHAPAQRIPEYILTKARSRKAARSWALRRSAKTSKSSTLAGKDVPAVIAGESGEDAVCSICYEEVESWPSTTTFWPPCCARDRWLHVPCIQRMSLSAGMHYLKCPLCNDKETFQKAIAGHGVYIPDRDASWELEGEAYADLYERPKSCSAEECKCYQGREYDADQGRWELKLCLTCGSVAAHAGCLSAARHVCELCSTVPPPDNLEALESIPLPRPEAESDAPEYRPLMSCRMSVRRTKPAATATRSSDARPHHFRKERVVRVVKSQLNDDDPEDVDVETIDQPCCSKTTEGGSAKAKYSIIKWLLGHDRSVRDRTLDVDAKEDSESSVNRRMSDGEGNDGSCLWTKLIEKSENSSESELNTNNVISEAIESTSSHITLFKMNTSNDDRNNKERRQSDERNVIKVEKQTSEMDKGNDEIESVVEIGPNESLNNSKDVAAELNKRNLRSERNHEWSESGGAYVARRMCVEKNNLSLETNFAKGRIEIKNMMKDIQDEFLTNDEILDRHVTDIEFLDGDITNDKVFEHKANDKMFADVNCATEGRLAGEKFTSRNISVVENETCEKLPSGKNENVIISDKNYANDNANDNENTISDNNDTNENISYDNETNGEVSSDNYEKNIVAHRNYINEDITSHGYGTNEVSSDNYEKNIVAHRNYINEDITSHGYGTNEVSSDNYEKNIVAHRNYINEDITSHGYGTNELSSDNYDENIISNSNDTDGNVSVDNSDSAEEASTGVGDAQKMTFDKNALAELEDRIISPLKMIEQRIYARLKHSDDGGFKKRIDDNVRRMRRPRPMSVKKKVIENILETLLHDCNTGAPTVRACQTAVAADGSTTEDYQSNCNETHSSRPALSMSPGHLQDATVQHSVDIYLNTDNIDLSADNVDSSADNVDLNTDNVDLNTDNIDLNTEEISLSTDNIVTPVKTVNNSIDSTKVEILESALEISCKETVNIEFVRPSIDSMKVESAKERSRLIIGCDASETRERIEKYNRREYKKCLKLKKRLNNVAEDILIESSKLDSENELKTREGVQEKKSTDKCPVRKWGAELSKAADLESFKSRYLSEVGQYKCNFNHKHKHQETIESKPRIKTAIDFAIEAAVKKRRQTKEAKAERALANGIDESSKEDSKNKSILKDELRLRHNKEVKFKDAQSGVTLEGVEGERANRNQVAKRSNSESEESSVPNSAEKVITPRKSIEVLQNLITAFENSNTLSGNIVLPSLSALGTNAALEDIRREEVIQSAEIQPEKVISPEKRSVVLEETVVVPDRRDNQICVPESGTSLLKPNLSLEKPVTSLEMPVFTLHPPIPLLDSVSTLEKAIPVFGNLISTVEKPPSVVEELTSTVKTLTSTVEKTTSTVKKSASTVEKSASTVEKSASTVEKSASTVEKSASTVEKSASIVEKPKYKTIMRPAEAERQSLETEVLTRGTLIKSMKQKFDKVKFVRLTDKPSERLVLMNDLDNLDDDGNLLVERKELMHLHTNLMRKIKVLTEDAPIKRERYRDINKIKRNGAEEYEYHGARYERELQAIKHRNRFKIKTNVEKMKDSAFKHKQGKNKKYRSSAEQMQKMKENEKLFDSLLREHSAEEQNYVEKAEGNIKERKKANAKGGKRKNEKKVEEESEKSKEEKRLSEKGAQVCERTDVGKQSKVKNNKIQVNKPQRSGSNERTWEEAKQEKNIKRNSRRDREIKKLDFDKTKKSKRDNEKRKETIVVEKEKTTEEKVKTKSSNSEARQKKRKRRRFSEDGRGFIDELDRVNEYYLKGGKRKKLNDGTDGKTNVDTEPKFKQSILNFSPNGPKIVTPPNDKEKTSHPVSQKKKRKIHDFPTDGLKQTTLNNFFSLHFTLT